MTYDQDFLSILNDNINMSVPLYLMASYAYYKDDEPILSDEVFDNLSKVMLKNWSKIKHIHKNSISKKDLEAGTFLGKYPSRIKGAVDSVPSALN